jgi:hypothetical protein
MSNTDIAIQAANDLIKAIQQPPSPTPFAQVGNQQMEALKQLAEFFQQHSQLKNTTLPRVLTKEPAQLPRVTTLPLSPSTTRMRSHKTCNHTNCQT